MQCTRGPLDRSQYTRGLLDISHYLRGVLFDHITQQHFLQSLAEAELQQRTIEVARTTRALEETVDEFEVKKIHDLKVCCVYRCGWL